MPCMRPLVDYIFRGIGIRIRCMCQTVCMYSLASFQELISLTKHYMVLPTFTLEKPSYNLVLPTGAGKMQANSFCLAKMLTLATCCISIVWFHHSLYFQVLIVSTFCAPEVLEPISEPSVAAWWEMLCTGGARLLAQTACLNYRSRLLSGVSTGSRQKSRRVLQQRAEQLLQAAVSAERAPAPADWDRLTTEYRQLVPSATVNTIDHKTLSACRQPDGGVALAAALSLLRHRQTQGRRSAARQPRPLPRTAGLRVTAPRVTRPRRRLWRRTLRSVRRRWTVWALAGAVVGLCATRHWRLALSLLPVARRGGPTPRVALSALAAAALRAGDDTVGWEMLKELSASRLRPADDAVDAWLERCEMTAHAESRAVLRGGRPGGQAKDLAHTAESGEEMVQRLLRYLASSGALLSEQQALRLRDLCTQRLAQPWSGEATQMSSRWAAVRPCPDRHSLNNAVSGFLNFIWKRDLPACIN